jgi:hypothetical protein
MKVVSREEFVREYHIPLGDEVKAVIVWASKEPDERPEPKEWR